MNGRGGKTARVVGDGNYFSKPVKCNLLVGHAKVMANGKQWLDRPHCRCRGGWIQNAGTLRNAPSMLLSPAGWRKMRLRAGVSLDSVMVGQADAVVSAGC
jgi:hypothetical protein